MIFMGATSSGNCCTCDAGYELTVMKLIQQTWNAHEAMMLRLERKTMYLAMSARQPMRCSNPLCRLRGRASFTADNAFVTADFTSLACACKPLQCAQANHLHLLGIKYQPSLFARLSSVESKAPDEPHEVCARQSAPPRWRCATLTYMWRDSGIVQLKRIALVLCAIPSCRLQVLWLTRCALRCPFLKCTV